MHIGSMDHSRIRINNTAGTFCHESVSYFHSLTQLVPTSIIKIQVEWWLCFNLLTEISEIPLQKTVIQHSLLWVEKDMMKTWLHVKLCISKIIAALPSIQLSKKHSALHRHFSLVYCCSKCLLQCEWHAEHTTNSGMIAIKAENIKQTGKAFWQGGNIKPGLCSIC